MKKGVLTLLVYLFMLSPLIVGALITLLTKNPKWLSLCFLYIITYGIGFSICEKFELGE